MAKLTYYLDTRASKGHRSPLKLVIRHAGTMAMISTGVELMPDQWRDGKVVGHPQRVALNALLAKRIADAELWLLDQRSRGVSLGKTATSIRRALEMATDGDESINGIPTLVADMRVIASLKAREKTRAVYEYTISRILAFDPSAEDKPYAQIDRQWLESFQGWLIAGGVSTNTIAIHMRNIRATFNRALDEERITCYPFRKLRVKTERTAKRSLSVEQLRALLRAPTAGTAEVTAVDYFMLTFYLIGINSVDLCNLKEIREGRIEYRRSKTGRLYSIKVEPEAMALIDKYRGENHLLRILDTRTSSEPWRRYTNKILKGVGATTIGKRGKLQRQPLYPDITTYWARHTWATIAASLDIPKETIAAALGHGGDSVTDIYIDFDRRKVDAANRRVIDYVLQLGEYSPAKD